MHFQEAPAFRSRRKVEEALYEAILAGHQSVFARRDEHYDLLFSGGWDSRGMLATAHALRYMPLRSISWGPRDEVPGSDPYLAGKLAHHYGLNHHFISYDTDSFIENAADWSYLTELCNDNFGWYGEGTNVLLNVYLSDANYALVGDECWGYGNHARNDEEAMAACHMPGKTSGVLARCLRHDLTSDEASIYFSGNRQDTVIV